MKRSEMKAAIADSMQAWNGTAAAAERILALIESAGIAWEPEQDEWPELRPEHRDGPFFHLIVEKGIGGRSLEAEEAKRVARVWNARRPGGEMEKRLKAVIDSLSGPNPAGPETTQDEIEAALRLGVEE